MSYDVSTNPKHCKAILLGTSALVCLALAAPVMAGDFIITSGTTTNNGNIINGAHTVTITGALVTTGGDKGIDTTGGTNTVTVTGTGSITTGTGNMAYGIRNVGNTNTTSISGSIETTGYSSRGIYNQGISNETTVSGSITTEGGNSYGINNRGSDNETTVSGSIKTEGNFSHGIHNFGSDNETTVSGSIKTEGPEARGINNFGSSNITTISGTVKATGTSSAALYNSLGSGNSFTLNEGATIIGDILADDGTTNSKLIFNLGASTSYAYSVSGKGEGTTAGQWNFDDLDGRSQVVSTLTGTNASVCDTTITTAGNTVCNLVTAVGNGNAEAQDELQFGMNTSMIGSLKRHAKPATAAATFALSTDTTPDTLDEGKYSTPQKSMPSTQVLKRNVWANVYGGTSERSSTTTQSSFDSSNRGLTIGTPVAINDTHTVDLVFNTSRTSLDIGSTKDQEITANSYNVGAVLRDLAPASGWAVDAYGFVGRNSYDGKRKVMNNQEATGSETVTASYSGMEVLVGVDAQYSQAINETLNFIGGVNASLSNEKIGAYSESKYYSWDARTLTQVAGGVTAGLEYHKDAFTSFATLGLQRSSLQKGKTAGYTNNGTAGSHTDTSGAATYASATVGFNYAADDSMSITGTAGMSRASGGISSSSVSLSANWTF